MNRAGDNAVQIRRYKPRDAGELAELFYQTVHAVNARDYTQKQLDAWADGKMDLNAWDQSLREHVSFVAVVGGVIAGFGDVDRTGYLDRLYVHKDYQGRGVATALCGALEQVAAGDVVTHASITARPFFEKRGYRVLRKQQVIRQDVSLTNYVMKKER